MLATERPLKRVVDNVAYNTDTSALIARKSSTRQDERGRAVHEMAFLFETTKGAYFIDKTSCVRTEGRSRKWDEIIPMTADEARNWLSSDGVEVIHDPFSEAISAVEPEVELGTPIYVRAPATLKQRVEAAAKQMNLSCNAWVIKCLEAGVTNPHVLLGPAVRPVTNGGVKMGITSIDMSIGSSEFLSLIAQNNCYVLFERSVPVGRLKRDFISIKHSDGRDLALSNAQGYRVCPVELPRAILDDYLRHSFIKQDGPEQDGSIIYRLTKDGLERGLS